MSETPRSDAPAASEAGGPTQAEGTGETVGEAKWAALRELERRHPGLDRDSVEFTVLSEGERGLLGVGFAPARVIATAAARAELAGAGSGASPGEPAGSPSARLRELIERICAALEVDARISIRDEGERLTASISGGDLGLLIGKHGQTIDAIQHLANAAIGRGDPERQEIVVDAAGYRDRRRVSLESLADRTVERVLETGEPIWLEPMTAIERKVVHLHLKERAGIATGSEGTEPNRCVVIRPAD